MKTGLIHVYCGDGKGKTTAAAGLALRAAGCGKKVLFVQFMKGNESGEITAMEQIRGIRIFRNKVNYGFYNKMSEEDKMHITKEHNDILQQVTESIERAECDILILDEITYPYQYNLIDKKAVEGIIKCKPPFMELVLTGRNPDQIFLEHADYITEMNCIRHPYEKGIAAREGIEY